MDPRSTFLHHSVAPPSYLLPDDPHASADTLLSLAHINWSKVPKSEKDKLWTTAKMTLLHKVKVEKVRENNANQDKLEKVMQNKKATNQQNKASQIKVQHPKKTKAEIIKCGMEVGLTSPNSAQVVALGTIQNVDEKANCMDGKPLCDYVEVLVNIVMKTTTVLPRAQGRICNMGSAQAHCIPWPKKNLVHADGIQLHSEVPDLASEMSANHSRKVATNQANSEAEMATNATQPQPQLPQTTIKRVEKERKKRASNGTMKKAAAKNNATTMEAAAKHNATTMEAAAKHNATTMEASAKLNGRVQKAGKKNKTSNGTVEAAAKNNAATAEATTAP